MNIKNTRSGFTLIELLVVISIVGVLSIVVLVSLKAGRDKAAIGAGLEFGASNYHAFGSSAIALWNFNDSASSLTTSVGAIDASFNNRTLYATDSATPISRSTVTPTGSGYSLAINQVSNAYASINVSGSDLSATQASNLTQSAWVYVTSMSGGGDTVVVATFGVQYPLAIILSPGNNSFGCYSDNLGTSPGGNTGTVYFGSVSLKTWYFVTCSLNSATKKMNGYINGTQKFSNSYAYSNTNAYPINSIEIGGDPALDWVLTPQFNGYIDDVAVYNQTLAESDIRQIYAESRRGDTVALKK